MRTTNNIDVYLFSIFAKELVTENTPYNEVTSFSLLLTDILKGVRSTFSDDKTQPIKDLTSRSRNEDHDQMPSFNEIYCLLANYYKSFYNYDLDEDEIQ